MREAFTGLRSQPRNSRTEVYIMQTKLNIHVRREGSDILCLTIEDESGNACDYWVDDNPATIGECLADFIRDYGTI